MTVHASKGLEFPIVFVVNMAKGASGPPKPIRVIASGDQDPSVSVGPFASELDDAERERELHETRRLLYVAVTRARDRLYFSSVLKEGTLAPGRGSLAEVLPPSIGGLFARAASAFPECPVVAWTGPSGQTFEWRICPVPRPEPPHVAEIEKVVDTFPKRVPATSASRVRRVTAVASAFAPNEAAVGALVHRIVASAHQLEHLVDGEARLRWVRGLMKADDVAALEDPGACAGAALDCWIRLSGRPEVVELLSLPGRQHEIPFSLRQHGTIVRGTIDCLVRKPDQTLVVVEFKTGQPRDEHQLQLDQYVRAAQEMFPGGTVEGRLIYS
jgi:ATP-dependent helicase/nuclease subunit A